MLKNWGNRADLVSIATRNPKHQVITATNCSIATEKIYRSGGAGVDELPSAGRGIRAALLVAAAAVTTKAAVSIRVDAIQLLLRAPARGRRPPAVEELRSYCHAKNALSFSLSLSPSFLLPPSSIQ